MVVASSTEISISTFAKETASTCEETAFMIWKETYKQQLRKRVEGEDTGVEVVMAFFMEIDNCCDF